MTDPDDIANGYKKPDEGGDEMDLQEKVFLEDYKKICKKHGMSFDCRGNIERTDTALNRQYVNLLKEAKRLGVGEPEILDKEIEKYD